MSDVKCEKCTRLPEDLIAIQKKIIPQWKAMIDMYCDHNCRCVNPDGDNRRVGEYSGECIGEICLIFGVRQEMESVKRGNYSDAYREATAE